MNDTKIMEKYVIKQILIGTETLKLIRHYSFSILNNSL
jgi:hypothetical protein